MIPQNHKNATNINVTRTKYKVEYINFCTFNFMVGKVLAACSTLSLNFEEVCIQIQNLG